MSLRNNDFCSHFFKNFSKSFSKVIFSEEHNLLQFKFLKLSDHDGDQDVCRVSSFCLRQKIPPSYSAFSVLRYHIYEIVWFIILHIVAFERTNVLFIDYHHLSHILHYDFSFHLL
jgi:hypothetical protein